MNREWDLSILYSGFDDEAFRSDTEKLEKLIDSLRWLSGKCGSEQPEPFLREYIMLSEELESTAEKLSIYAGLRSAVNTADSEAVGALSTVSSLLSGAAEPQAVIQAYIAGKKEGLNVLSIDS